MAKYKVRWLEIALSDLEDACDYLLERNEEAATNLFVTVCEQVEQLADFPVMGRIGRLKGTRELVISGTPYVVAYQLGDGTVFVLALIHGARNWPVDFD